MVQSSIGKYFVVPQKFEKFLIKKTGRKIGLYIRLLHEFKELVDFRTRTVEVSERRLAERLGRKGTDVKDIRMAIRNLVKWGVLDRYMIKVQDSPYPMYKYIFKSLRPGGVLDV